MFFSYILILFITHYIPIEAYTLTPPETLLDGETLTSQDGTFKLGFFTPSATSKNRYLGIWFNKIPVQTVVWVANRDSPIQDTSGFLNIDSTVNLNLVATVFNQTENVVWSTNSSKVLESPIVEFLDSGNLVLRDLGNADPETYLWQSFDYPTDTVLPGMRLGGNRKTGMNWYVSSWMNFDNPSRGDYKWGLELDGYPEFIMRKGGNRYYRGGIWNGLQASSAPEWKPTPQFTYKYIDNAEETYFTYQQVNRSITMRLVMTQTNTEGYFQLMTWVDKTNSWILQFRLPRDRCDTYKLCGTYSSCDVSNIELCQCLKGFKPRSQEDWNRLDWSMGCEHNVPIKCSNGEGFKKYSGVTLPQLTNSWVNASMNLEECRVKCLTNCSCVAYSNLDIRESGSGCILWFTDLSDIRSLRGARPDLYIRMAASEVRSGSNSLATSKAKLRVTLIVTFASIGVLVLGLGVWFFQKKRSMKGAIEKDIIELPLYSKRDDPELPLFDWDTILSATNNFSLENKLGEGGFGPVYKGVLDGEEIAVKRLSKNSIQGVNEFKNEVILISKLQHRNLVRILGCCIQGEEMTLIYEYMQNNSLDSYIFDETKGQLLDWEKRAQIIAGIARGLLYLHHDSRLRIIHRDLKASNILLDSELVAKISDFGLARIFGGDQMEARTRRVVGTRGYMSPEYAIDGNFSVKSDVFSFGVLVLEIISGKRNRGFFHPDHEHNLLGHAWRLWKENKSMELVHKSIISTSCVEEISRYIHIGLLCVQKRPIQRPTISAVALMLSSESMVLPQPQTPGFFTERSICNEEIFCNSDNFDDTVTLLEGR